MNEILTNLTALDPLLRSLAKGDPEFYDEVHQRTAFAIVERDHKGQSIALAICVGIARHAACDMVSEQYQRRQRFVTFTDLEGTDDTDHPEFSRMTHTGQTTRTFDAVWAKLCCQPLRYVVTKWRTSLRPQERRVLRGLSTTALRLPLN